MACAASTGTVHPVPVKDASESLLRVDNEPETGKGDMHINRPWGKLDGWILNRQTGSDGAASASRAGAR